MSSGVRMSSLSQWISLFALVHWYLTRPLVTQRHKYQTVRRSPASRSHPLPCWPGICERFIVHRSDWASTVPFFFWVSAGTHCQCGKNTGTSAAWRSYCFRSAIVWIVHRRITRWASRLLQYHRTKLCYSVTTNSVLETDSPSSGHPFDLLRIRSRYGPAVSLVCCNRI